MLKMKRIDVPGWVKAAGVMIVAFVLGALYLAPKSVEASSGSIVEGQETASPIDAGQITQESLDGSDIYCLAMNATSPVPCLAAARETVGGRQYQANGSSPEGLAAAGITQLTAEEQDGLIYMREEEKLARDVYRYLYEEWGLPVFQNIARSEQTHMDSILWLLEQFELNDPAAGNGAGEFNNPLFQSLYSRFIEQGSISTIDALKVGAAIEELDIADLESRIAQSESDFINQVYSRLLLGSRNHLRAFASNIERQSGEIYQPVYLEQDAYDSIMDSAAGGGPGGSMGGAASWKGNDSFNGGGNGYRFGQAAGG